MGLTILLVDDDQILTEKTKFINLGQSWHRYGVYCKQYS